MFLTSANIVHYLLERGLVSAHQIVDGDFIVVEAPRRNRNFKVMKRDRTGLFLKQVQRWDQPSIATLQLEAHCYRLTNENSQFAPLRDLVPRFRGYDERRAVLVTELLGGAETLAEYHYRTGGFPNEVGEQLGRAFGNYHRLRNTSDQEANGTLFPRRVPWILSFQKMAPEALQDISGGNRQLLDLLKRYPDFGIALDRLASDWKFDCLIHGDIKWDNCVLTPSMNDTVKLKLVDWELADWGDASWDVAAIFSSFIVFWIQSLPMRPEGSIAQAISETRFPIERMQPAIRSFWNAYVAEMQLDRVAAREVLRRAVAMCGARTIQTAYEFGQAAPQLNQLTYFILQASLNILARPEEASSELLGLTIQ